MEQRTFSGRLLLDFLAQLEASPGDYLTLYLRPSSFPRYAAELAVELGPFAEEIRGALGAGALCREAQRYGTGAVVFWSEGENKHSSFQF